MNKQGIYITLVNAFIGIVASVLLKGIPALNWDFFTKNAPLFGEHNRELICDLLGHSPSELAELAAAGIIGDAPIGAKEG